MTWIDGSPPPTDRVEVKVRYRSPAHAATIEAADDSWIVHFDEPVEAVAPGQAGVVYQGDEVLGGGTIAAALRGVGV